METVSNLGILLGPLLELLPSKQFERNREITNDR